MTARNVCRSRTAPLDHRSQLIAVRWMGVDADGDEASVSGSLAARHNQRRHALRVQRRSEALVQGGGTNDLLDVVLPSLGGGEVTAQEDSQTPTPRWQVVLAPAQWPLAPITSHPRTLREVPLRATSCAQAAAQSGVGNDVRDLRVQDLRALDQSNDVVGRARDGLVVIDGRQRDDAAAVAGTAADHAGVLDSLQRLANRAASETRFSAELCLGGEAAPQGIAPIHDLAGELLGQLAVSRADGHRRSVAPRVTLTRQIDPGNDVPRHALQRRTQL
jgi:hypothetical protein